MNKVTFNCRGCGSTLAVESIHGGRRVECPGCLTSNVAPEMQNRTSGNEEMVCAPGGLFQDNTAIPPGEEAVIKNTWAAQKPSQAKVRIIAGVFWMILGIILTAATAGQWLFWGAIIFGFIDIIMGIFQGLSEGF